MIKILVNDGMHPDGQQLLEEANFQVDTHKVAQEDLPKALPNYDVIVVRSATTVRKDLIDKCPNLKIIARGGVGLDNIDVNHAKSKNIEVINTPAASAPAVAELAFAYLRETRLAFTSVFNQRTGGEKMYSEPLKMTQKPARHFRRPPFGVGVSRHNDKRFD